jgi:hypothetical protein
VVSRSFISSWRDSLVGIMMVERAVPDAFATDRRNMGGSEECLRFRLKRNVKPGQLNYLN